MQSQQRIDALDDETVALLSQYHSELERLSDLETYNTNMRKMRASQELEKERLSAELTEVEVVRRELFPLMVEMIDLLDRFIELDQPLLLVERKARLAALRENLNRSNVTLGEKYRRVIEAYQIEAEYGRSIEAYEGSLTLDGRDLTVDFLRVGRLALYYISLDGSEAGLWDPAEKQWHDLDEEYLSLLDFALRVARKQAFKGFALLQVFLFTLATYGAESASQEAQAQPETLAELVRSVRDKTARNQTRLAEREQRFIAARNERAQLLRDVRQRRQAAENEADRLRAEFETGEEELADLETKLDENAGDLREVFSVVRQVAGDVAPILQNSLVAAQMGQRSELVERLASGERNPTSAELRELWLTLLDEMEKSGHVARFETEVITATGEEVMKQVTRIGTFTALADGQYLRFLPDSGKLLALARQPAGTSAGEALKFEQAQQPLTSVAIDPSRGSILALIVQTPEMSERIKQGGVIGYLILLIGAIGVALGAYRLAAILLTQRKVRREQSDPARDDGHTIATLRKVAQDDAYQLDASALSAKLDEVVAGAAERLNRGLPTLAIIAAVSPLLGLLGTVTGMIETFQVITLFGAGDPRLMSGGISQALITTQLGLAVAIPLLLLHSFLQGRANMLITLLDQTATNLFATQRGARVLTAILPLLGLLGTVIGMIKTFEVMTAFGSGNVRGMAEGISQALITTMAGLMTALAGMYFASDLDNRIDRETEHLSQVLNTEGGNAAINLTPLIDMVFILLIFFAVNSTFVKLPGVEIDQPSAKSTTVQKAATILIAVTDVGDIWIDKKKIDIRRVRGVIEQMFLESPDASVVVLSDQDSRTGLVVEVIDQARLAGASKVAIAAAEAYAAIGLLAIAINIILYITMENMISRDRVRLFDAVDAQTIDFVRADLENETKIKDRRRKPPPKPQEIKRPQARMDPNIAAEATELPTTAAMMNITSFLADGGGVALGAQLVQGSGDSMMDIMMASELTALSRLPPQYPPSALMREQEGYVDVLFEVATDGSVHNAVVIEANPTRVFERAALAAVSRWRFQPVVREGRPVSVRARVHVEFNLPPLED
ncbi:exbD2 [Symbiodinium pilosum]|uniref:ExbD2 protein n=1 Tax=Symbiodinium pilosum TaxID=2952 RepID=A0A812NNT7_SYMPI|nr:exbD2 [Symbiodinium pilosum]